MNKPDIILWDWDNTLVNTRAIAAKALRRLGKETNVSVSENDITEVIGGHLVDFWYRHYGDNPLTELKRFIAYYQELNHAATLFPETKEILSFVQESGIPQMVISNKNEDILIEEAERFGITSYFQKVVGTIGNGIAKPTKEFADFALGKEWPKNILMIGDGQSDMQFAKTLGAFGLLIRDESIPTDFDYDKRVSNLSETLTFLKEHLK